MTPPASVSERESAVETLDDLREAMMALDVALRVAEEAFEEWDSAPEGMKAGKLLRSLLLPTLKYRADVTAMHTTRARLNALLDRAITDARSKSEGEK